MTTGWTCSHTSSARRGVKWWTLWRPSPLPLGHGSRSFRCGRPFLQRASLSTVSIPPKLYSLYGLCVIAMNLTTNILYSAPFLALLLLPAQVYATHVYVPVTMHHTHGHSKQWARVSRWLSTLIPVQRSQDSSTGITFQALVLLHSRV